MYEYEYGIECIECGWMGFEEDLLPEDENLEEFSCCPECLKEGGIVDF